MGRRSTSAAALALVGGAALIAGFLTPVTATAAPSVTPQSSNYTYGTWSAVGAGLNNTVYTLLSMKGGTPSVVDDSLVAVGVFRNSGDDTVNRIAKYSGSAWGNLAADDSGISPLVATTPASGSGPSRPGIYGGDISEDDSLYVGGVFQFADDDTVNNVARWTGSGWQRLGRGLQNAKVAEGYVVQDVIVGNDPSNTVDTDYADDTIFAVGGITGICTNINSCPEANSTSNFRGVAQWSDDTWTFLSPATFNRQPITGAYLDDTTSTDDTLIVAGEFTRINGTPDDTFNYIAAWSYADDTWHNLGYGLNNAVYGTTVHPITGDVYAVGKFTARCSNLACTTTEDISDGVAKWDRADGQWYSVGTGLGGAINLDDIGFSPDGSIAYVVGFGGTASGAPMSGIATITGADFNTATTNVSGTWGYVKSVGEIGVTGNARSVIVNNDGSVYVGGGFSKAGPVTAANVALFTPGAEPDPNAPATPPGPPLNVVATPGWQTVTVNWDPPTDQGTYPVTNYLVQATPGGRVCITRLTDAKLTECTFTSLTPGVQYTFTVQGLNGGGWGQRSAASNAATPYELKITNSNRKKLTLLKVQLGSEVTASGTALGYPAGTRITVFIKEGNTGPWVEQANTKLTSDASGRFTWKRKFSKNKNATPISIQFGIANDRSNVARLGPVK